MDNPRMATAGRKLEEMAAAHTEMEEKEGGDHSANEHLKKMWQGQSNVLVAVRVRPLMKHDVVKRSCVRVLDSKVIVILDPSANDKHDVLRANRNREKQYAFDYVFEQAASQESVYHHTTKFLIHGVLDGFNATVFAYGQTGSGKTYTMIGSQNEPGIMVRVMNDLFQYCNKSGDKNGVNFKVTVSFLEVYNENIRDLLSEIEDYLDLREDPIKGPVIAGITEVEAKNSDEIMDLLHQGNSRRTQQPTAANEVSSRSHAVLQVVVEGKDKAPGTVANIKVGKLSLVDLAGSERAANTQNRGARLVEGANINRSLLALGNCINALGEKGNKGNFVPYRDSKLTRLLKDSLGGNCRTVMIANISCAESAFEETLNTLKYANRAKNIKTNVQRNVLNVNFHISEYVQLINNLRGEIKVLKDQIKTPGDASSTPPGLVGSLPSPGGMRDRRQPSTPLNVLRESMRSAASMNSATGESRGLVNNMRQRIVDNFQERMQLRRSLIELEDQNVQNSIEVGKRQLIVVQWSEGRGVTPGNSGNQNRADFAASLQAKAPLEIREAWQECEQLRKAILKNNAMKKNISKRLRHNEREADKFRSELNDKITGEDRRELMELQYQVGRLELENMELEQHRIVHQSILKGKDLMIQKLRLQVAVRDKVIARQRSILEENNLDALVGYQQLALVEQDAIDGIPGMAPPSPPRDINTFTMNDESMDAQGVIEVAGNVNGNDTNHSFEIEGENNSSTNLNATSTSPQADDSRQLPDLRDVTLTSRDHDFVRGDDWSEVAGIDYDQNSFSPLDVRKVYADAGDGAASNLLNRINNKSKVDNVGNSNSNNNDGNKLKSNARRAPRGGRQYHRADEKVDYDGGDDGSNSKNEENLKEISDQHNNGNGIHANGELNSLPAVNFQQIRSLEGKVNGYAMRKNYPIGSNGNGNINSSSSSSSSSSNTGFTSHASPRAAGAGIQRKDRVDKNRFRVDTVDPMEIINKKNDRWLGNDNNNSSSNSNANEDSSLSPRLSMSNSNSKQQADQMQRARQRKRDLERERMRMQMAEDDGVESVNTMISYNDIGDNNSEVSDMHIVSTGITVSGVKNKNNSLMNRIQRKNKGNEIAMGPGIGQLISNTGNNNNNNNNNNNELKFNGKNRRPNQASQGALDLDVDVNVGRNRSLPLLPKQQTSQPPR